ncbi:MAG: hypothetical protein ICV66_00925 [Chitinophagaceae bacterium]|nr:hypothetical protein [Chitinophagaceae bacterium]
MKTATIKFFENINVDGENTLISVRDFGSGSYVCYFEDARFIDYYKLFGFKIFDDKEVGFELDFPKNDPNLTKDEAKNIWEQIKPRLDSPDHSITIPLP